MNTLSAELLDMLEVVRALNFAAEEEGSAHWITLKNQEGAGTTHVKIDGGGNIQAGPKSLEGQNVGHIQKHPLYDRRTGQVFNQHHKSSASEPSTSSASGMKTGLYGQSFIDSSGVGDQKPLFHQPVEYQKPDTAEFKKFKEQDTPGMFPAKGEGAPKGESNAHPDRDPSPDVGAGNGPPEPPEKPVAARTPDEPERDSGSEPAVPAGGSERGNPSEGEEGAEPNRSVEQQPQSEQDIAQAVNRGEMSVDDVLPTHPHLAGDALIEQHKRERDEEIERARAEQEMSEHAQGSEADLPEGELPDFGDMEGEQPTAEPEPEAAPAMEEPAAEPQQPEVPRPPARQPAQSNKAPSRRAIEKMLLDNLSAVGGGYTAQDEHELNEAAGAGNPFTFHKEIPTEVKDFIAGHPEAAGLRKLFRVTNNPAEAGGADAFGQLGDRYLNIAEAKAGTPIRQALQEAKNSPDPQVRLLAAIYELPKGEVKGRPQSVNPQKLETGSKFTIKGVPVEVTRDDQGHRVLKDGGELPEVPIDAITEALPVDRGSLKPGKPAWAEQKPAEQPAADVEKPSPEAPAVPAARPQDGDLVTGIQGRPWSKGESIPQPQAVAPAAPPEPKEQPKAPELAPAPESAPAGPQTQAEAAPPSPEQLQADVQGGLSVLGINPRQAETLAKAAMAMGHTSVADAIAWALKNPTAKPPAAATPALSLGVPAASPASKPAPAAAMSMQAVRQRAKTTPPPSNMPPLQHQGPPAKIPQNKQAVSALAANRPPKVSGPKPPKPHLPSFGHARSPRVVSVPPISKFIGRQSHLKAGHVPAMQSHLKAGHVPAMHDTAHGGSAHGKRISEREARRAKGRTIEQMGHFAADDGQKPLARMLALLEMVS